MLTRVIRKVLLSTFVVQYRKQDISTGLDGKLNEVGQPLGQLRSQRAELSATAAALALAAAPASLSGAQLVTEIRYAE
jgi:hypothetical protein